MGSRMGFRALWPLIIDFWLILLWGGSNQFPQHTKNPTIGNQKYSKNLYYVNYYFCQLYYFSGIDWRLLTLNGDVS